MSASNQLTNDPDYGLPIGCILPYASSIQIPPNFLYCDGASVLRADYPDLFERIGVIYGSADALHFNIPSVNNRFIMGSANNTNAQQNTAFDCILEFPALTTDNLPNTALPIDSPDFTFSGTIGNGGCIPSPPPFQAVGYDFQNKSFEPATSASFSGGTVNFGSATLENTTNTATPIVFGGGGAQTIAMKGYTMPYIIKALPCFVS